MNYEGSTDECRRRYAISKRIKCESGDTFGNLIVEEQVDDIVGSNGTKYTAYLCRCTCGNRIIAKATLLKSGRTQSCGCLTSEKIRASKTKHGCSKKKNRLYEIWRGMKARCTNPNHVSYKSYGGREIQVCEEWSIDFRSFQQWALKHGYNDSKSIDRIDVNQGYCPENCRWSDDIEQANNKRNSRIIACHGKSQTLNQWAVEMGVRRELIRDRIDRLGWDAEQAIMTPARQCKKHIGGINA